MMLKPPHRHLHQGALYVRVPIAWVTEPLWVLRPNHRPFDEGGPRLARDVSDLFLGDDGWESVVAQAKARPVVVLSGLAELRRLRTVRVVPLYSYRPGSALERMRGEIEDGKVGSTFHLEGDDTLGIHDGALRLDQIRPVDHRFLTQQAASLSDAALAALVEKLALYVQGFDRRQRSA